MLLSGSILRYAWNISTFRNFRSSSNSCVKLQSVQLRSVRSLTSRTSFSLQSSHHPSISFSSYPLLIRKMSSENSNAKDNKKKGQDKFKSTPATNTNEVDAKVAVNIPTVPEGQLKDFSTPMADAYDPAAVEANWDSYWEAQNFYKPNEEDFENKEKFVIVIPPPNVTGTLHLGHALTIAVEDTLVRYHRMRGHSTLWVPGTDHAGIATQVVVEKNLMREKKLTRHDLGREKFLEEVWKFKEAHESIIKTQIRRMGASVDWTREAFTMSPALNRAVNETFFTLYNRGLIYRANRLVNWSCTLRTAISTIEVEYLDLEQPTEVKVPGYDQKVRFGVIHSFAYKMADSDEEIVVATTRLETMLGDVAVAVHPEDPRYKHLHNRYAKHPFIADRQIQIITDATLVDMNFGSGAVKITPAHDPNDFACGQRNKLEMINIFNDDGTINENGGKFAGKKRFDVRLELIEELTKLGLYRGEAPNKMALGICSRSKDIVEPVLRPQWWVDCSNMAKKAVAAVENKELNIVPESYTKVWYHWLNNIQDWCISRQLWWGHRIPAYFVERKVDGVVSTRDNPDDWVVARSEEEAHIIVKQKFPGTESNAYTLHQDEDVLDTWFSSGLFPFSVMGWPDKTPDFAKFYPGTLLETGHDILFFWVARMVMLGLEITDKLPFTNVYLHAMVRDKFGRKMSKSLGNVVDPLDVVNGISLDGLRAKLLTGNLDQAEVARVTESQKREFPNGIATCGADALRFGLLAYTTQGRDINLDIQRVVAYRQFCNKLWQASRFSLQNFPTSGFVPPKSISEIVSQFKPDEHFSHKWILSRLAFAVQKANNGFATYEFAEITTACYNFWLYDLCDNYLELIKPIFRSGDASAIALTQAVLYTCFHTALRLLHPIMPFISEELFHRLPQSSSTPQSIVIQPYPLPEDFPNLHQPSVEANFTILGEIAHSVRSIRTVVGLTKQRVPLYVICSDAWYNILAPLTTDISTLSFSGTVQVLRIAEASQVPSGSINGIVSPDVEVFVHIRGVVDFGVQLVKMEKQCEDLRNAVNTLSAKMNAPGYDRTPEDVRIANKEKIEADKSQERKLRENMNSLFEIMDNDEKEKYREDKRRLLLADIDLIMRSMSKFTTGLPEDRSKAPKKTLAKIAELEEAKRKIEEKIAQI